MKKILAVLMALTMILALASCGGNNETPSTNGTSSTEGTSSVESTSSVENTSSATALDVLNTIWATYGEEERFMAGGGSAEAIVDGAPGAYDISDAEVIDNDLGIPAASVSKITNAASLKFMMNANSFTAAAYQLKDAADAQTLADEIKANLADRHWMCGFPERLYIVSVGDVVVATYGIADFMNIYVQKVGTVEGATVLVDMPFEI